MSWKKVLKSDPTEWLLEDNNPSVRYWTLRELFNKSNDDEDVCDAKEAIMASKLVKTILKNQKPEGFWGNEDDIYLPKYLATTHQLLILAEAAASRTISIEKAIEHVYRFQRTSGHFLTKLPKTKKGKKSVVRDGCCIDGNILYYLIHFGYLDDPRTKSLIDFIIDYHDKDNGGWKCRAYPIGPSKVFPVNCYMGATKILKAFSIMPEEAMNGEIREIIEKNVEIILENQVFRYLKNPDGSRKEKFGWKRFGFPLFYQSDILEVCNTLTCLGVKDDRMKDSIDYIIDTQQDDGKWLLKHTFNGKMILDVDEKHQPSKWITMRAMNSLKRFFTS